MKRIRLLLRYSKDKFEPVSFEKECLKRNKFYTVQIIFSSRNFLCMDKFYPFGIPSEPVRI